MGEYDFKRIQMTAHHEAARFAKADADGDEFLSKEEFVRFRYARARSAARAVQLFPVHADPYSRSPAHDVRGLMLYPHALCARHSVWPELHHLTMSADVDANHLVGKLDSDGDESISPTELHAAAKRYEEGQPPGTEEPPQEEGGAPKEELNELFKDEEGEEMRFSYADVFWDIITPSHLPWPEAKKDEL